MTKSFDDEAEEAEGGYFSKFQGPLDRMRRGKLPFSGRVGEEYRDGSLIPQILDHLLNLLHRARTPGDCSPEAGSAQRPVARATHPRQRLLRQNCPVCSG